MKVSLYSLVVLLALFSTIAKCEPASEDSTTSSKSMDKMSSSDQSSAADTSSPSGQTNSAEYGPREVTPRTLPVIASTTTSSPPTSTQPSTTTPTPTHTPEPTDTPTTEPAPEPSMTDNGIPGPPTDTPIDTPAPPTEIPGIVIPPTQQQQQSTTHPPTTQQGSTSGAAKSTTSRPTQDSSMAPGSTSYSTKPSTNPTSSSFPYSFLSSISTSSSNSHSSSSSAFTTPGSDSVITSSATAGIAIPSGVGASNANANPINNNNSTAAIAGGAVGGVAGIALLGGLLVCLHRRKGARRANRNADFAFGDDDFNEKTDVAGYQHGYNDPIPNIAPLVGQYTAEAPSPYISHIDHQINEYTDSFTVVSGDTASQYHPQYPPFSPEATDEQYQKHFPM